MTPALEHVDATLLLIAEARDRAERALRELGDLGSAETRAALTEAERTLLDAHNKLMRSVYFPGESAAQLKLAG